MTIKKWEDRIGIEHTPGEWRYFAMNAESNGAQHPTRTPGYRAGTNTGEKL